jgi:hypothetical protein
MNKKPIVLLVIALVIIMVTIIGFYYFYNRPKIQQISFDVKSGVSASIYKVVPTNGSVETNATASISHSTTLSLEQGKYSIIPSGKDLDTTPIIIVVTDKAATIAIKPGFSKQYLEKLVATEKAKVDTLLTSTYPQISVDFTINAGALYQDGQWYSTTMTQKANPGNNGDVYHVVLHKQNNEWQVAVGPQIILTKANSPNVPEDVLKASNKQES